MSGHTPQDASIRIRCPHCQKEFIAPSSLMGQTGPCGFCQQAITINQDTIVPAAVVTIPPPVPTAPPLSEATTSFIPFEPISAPPPPISPPVAAGIEREWVTLEPGMIPSSPGVTAMTPGAFTFPGGMPPSTGVLPTVREPEQAPSTHLLPAADMNVKAGLAIWAALVLLMAIFQVIQGSFGLVTGLVILAMLFGGYVIAVVRAVHGAYAWIGPSSTFPEEQRLYRLIQSAAAKAGLPAPRIALAKGQSDINAWTYGINANHAYVVVTDAFLNHVQPTDAELEAVLAHELGHIRYGDCKISTLLQFPIWLLEKLQQFMAWMRNIAVSLFPLVTEVASGAGCIGIFIILGALAFILYLSMYIAILAGIMFIVMLFINAFGREREYLADMHSAQVLGTVQPLQSGLAKLEQATERVVTELKQRVANAQENEQIDVNIAAPEVAFQGEHVIAEALSAQPRWWDFIAQGEIFHTHPGTKFRIYYLLNPTHRHQVWTKFQQWLEERCERRVSYRAADDPRLAPTLILGGVIGALMGGLTAFTEHWAIYTTLLLLTVIAGYLLGNMGASNRWSGELFIRRAILASFSTATSLLVVGSLFLNPASFFFLPVFIVCAVIYIVIGTMALARG